MKCSEYFSIDTHCYATRRQKRMLLTRIISFVITVGLGAGISQAAHISGPGHGGQTGAIYNATIERIQIADEQAMFSGALITLEGGHTVIVPANLLVDLPANRLTLQQFCFGPDVPLNEQGTNPLTGIGKCGVGHVALILANRQPDGTVVAGDVFIHKNEYEYQGIVTSINSGDGSFVLDGELTVRINDPEAVHSVQGDINNGNGSPDRRYTNDPTNYTILGTTGYPFCINGPNCTPNSGRLGGEGKADATDSTRFEPLLVGDWVSATGNIENLGTPDQFQSVHTLFVGVQITSLPGTADYILVEEAEWDVNSWANQRLKGLNIGVMSSNASSTITRIAMNGAADATATGACEKLEFIGGTDACETVGGNCTANTAATVLGGTVVRGNGQVVKSVYDWDFIIGESKPFRNPAAVVDAFGDPDGLLDPNASDANNSFSVFSPVMREIIYSTGTWNACQAGTGPCFDVFDANDKPAQWGFYLSPNGIGYPEWGEIDLAAFSSPFNFEGISWNMDRRLGPGGGDELIANTPMYDSSMALTPFPTSGSSPCAVIDGLSGPFVPTNCSLSFVTQDTCTGQQGPVDTTHLVTDPSALLAVLASAPAPVVTDPVVTDPVVTDPVVTDPVVTDPVVTDPVVTDPSVEVVPATNLVGTVDPRGRYRIEGFCPAGADEVVSSEPSVRCTLSVLDNSFRCRGIRLEPGLEITITCLGPNL